MRIRELDIENFGVFRDRQMRFDPGLQVIYGPNEAGKTTLLQLVRQLLFGFPHRNAYNIADHAGPLSAKATVEMQDGHRLWFRRRKGRPDKVVGELEKNREQIEVDDRLLTAMLGNATAQLYDNVFGFSLNELAEGTASLQDANLTDALYGSGIGNIANVQHVRTELENDAKRIFNSRSKKSEVMQVLAQLQTDEQTWRAAQVSPRQHREMLAEQVNADQTADRLKKDLLTHREAASARQRFYEAVPAFQQWKELKEQLAKLPSFETDIDADAPTRFKQIQTELADAEKVRKELEDALARLQRELEKLPPDGAYSQHADEIQRLHQQVGRLHDARELLPRRKQEAETIRENVLRELQSINPEWTSDSLAALQAGVEQRDLVQRLSEQHNRIDRKRSQCRARLKELRHQEARWKAILEAPQSQVDLVERARKLAESIADNRADRTRLAEAQTELNATTDQVDSLANALTRVKGWRGDVDLSVMSRDDVAAWREKLGLLERESKDAKSQRQSLEAERDALRTELAALEGDSAPPEEELIRARAERAEAFGLVREFVETRGDAEFAALTEWAKEPRAWPRVQQLIDRVDAITDEILRAADVVAQRGQVQLRLQASETRLTELQQNLTTAESEWSGAKQAWLDCWRDADLVPLDPADMQKWLEEHFAWRELVERQVRLEQRTRQLRAKVDNFESSWEQLLSEADVEQSDAPPSNERVSKREGSAKGAPETKSAVERGAAWLERHRDLAQQRDVAAKELAAVAARMAETGREAETLETEDEQWAEQWAKLLGQLSFPPHWEPALVQRVFQTLADAASRLRQATSLTKEAETMASEVEKAEQRVRVLTDELGISPARMPVDALIATLYETLEDERQGQRVKHELSMQKEAASRRLRAAQEDEAKLLKQLKKIQAALNVSDPEEMKKQLERLDQRADLLGKVQEAQSRLQTLGSQLGEEDLGRLEAKLADLDRDQLLAEIQDDRIRNKELESELEQVQRRAGAAAAALDRLTESTVATESARELASGYARLGQLVDRWAPLAMANQLLAMSMEQFERVNQPALLQETSRLYQQFTDGRYVKVIRKLDDKQSIAVEDPHGQWKTTNELSTGAREQLYLAIRLAYVAEYCRRAEPLPIVMDDVLVNFDDTRAANALSTLQKCAANQQVLFLTCHQRVVDLAEELAIPTMSMKVRDSVASRKPPKRNRAPLSPKVKTKRIDHDEPDGPTQKDLFPRG